MAHTQRSDGYAVTESFNESNVGEATDMTFRNLDRENGNIVADPPSPIMYGNNEDIVADPPSSVGYLDNDVSPVTTSTPEHQLPENYRVSEATTRPTGTQGTGTNHDALIATPPTSPTRLNSKPDVQSDAPKGWPNKSKPIKHSIPILIWTAILDFLLFSCSVAFFAFALVVQNYKQASTADNPRATRMLINATRYVSIILDIMAWRTLTLNEGPTVFPILFASVIGRATHAILLWRIERGERIGILDTLATSTSLTNVVVSQFQLRMFTFLGISLVAFWSMSPIGGQATLRQMSIGTADTVTPTTFGYVVNHPISQVDLIGSFYPLDQVVNALFGAALMGSEAAKTSPLDAWGNVKIPRIERYEEGSEADAEGWHDTKDRDLNSFSSLIGMPTIGINSSQFVDYKLSLQSSYLNLQCSSVGEDPNYSRPENYTTVSGSGADISYLWTNERNQSRLEIPPESLPPMLFQYIPHYGNMGNESRNFNCSIHTTYVETEVYCGTSTTCVPTRVRRSQLDQLPPAWTLLDIDESPAQVLFDGLIESTRGSLADPSIIDLYLGDPVLTASVYMGYTPIASEKDFTVRMGQLLNAYYTCMIGQHVVAGGLGNQSAYYTGTNFTFIPNYDELPVPTQGGRFDSKPMVWYTPGTYTVRREVIVAHKPWVVVLCIISILLILSSLVSPFLQVFFIRAPDLAMNISSLATRDNKYVPLPASGSSMDASKRARLLKAMRVRFGDVREADASGWLAISVMDGGGREAPSVERIQKGRRYD